MLTLCKLNIIQHRAMNQQTILLLSILIAFNHTYLLGNNDSTFVMAEDEVSTEVSMNLEIDGTIKLYSVFKDDIYEKTEKSVPIKNEKFLKWVLNSDKDFYINFGDETELITPSNFKRLAKKYFSSSPLLVERIGKRGFRYKNLPSMIIFYNKAIAKEGGLTKNDVIKNNL
jgi:hypothetical protein